MDERAGEATPAAEPAPETTPARPARKPFRLSSLVALVACAGAMLWAYKSVKDGMRPSIGWSKLVRSGDVDDRQIAARQLGDSNPEDLEIAFPALVAAMGDRDERVRAAAAAGLGVAGITAIGKDRQKAEVRQAAKVLSIALADPGPEVKMAAATSLGEYVATSMEAGFPVDPAEAAEAITKLLTDPSIMVRKRGETALGRVASKTSIGPPSTLLEGVKSWPLKESRATAAFVLGSFKASVGPTVQALEGALKDPKPEVRGNAIVALQKFGREAAPAVPALVASLGDPFVPPPPPPPRFPGIVGMPSPGGGGSGGDGSSDEAPDPAAQAARALGRIAKAQADAGEEPAPEVVPALSRALQADRPELREAAEDALKRIGKAASATIPGLIDILAQAVPKKDDPGRGPTVAALLGAIAPETEKAPEAVAALTSAIDAKDPATRKAAVEALGQFGTAAAAALPKLAELAKANGEGGARDEDLAKAIQSSADKLEGKAPAEPAQRKGQGRRGRGGVARP